MSLIKNLVRNWEDFSIEIPEWEIPDHGITALVGPSGSGKTSIFRLLIGLEKCPSLSWLFQGKDLAQMPIPQKRLGVVFQNFELFPHMSAQENIIFAAESRKMERQETEVLLKKLIQSLKLENCVSRRTSLLSGGEMQRVALARAIIGKPRFLFLDEPFSALDVELKVEARKLVKNTLTEFQIPSLLITHDPEDIKNMADLVCHIKNGKLI